jgi:hypothetical protein
LAKRIDLDISIYGKFEEIGSKKKILLSKIFEGLLKYVFVKTSGGIASYEISQKKHTDGHFTKVPCRFRCIPNKRPVLSV